MTCAEALKLIQAFGDGELTGDGLALVRDHLRACVVCRTAYDERRRLVQGLAAALVSETSAPADLTRSVWQRISSRPMSGQHTIARPVLSAVGGMRALAGRRPVRVAFSLAGVIGIVLALTWMLFGRELALAKAIDQAMRQVRSAHFVAVEGGRKIEVWATPEADRVARDDGWMIAKGGKAYLFDPSARRVTITKGPLAQLQLLRGLNVLMLSARVRGQAMGEPTVAKETVTLPDGRRAIKITASGKAKVLGQICDFTGVMLVDPATNLIMGGEVTETTPEITMGEEVRQLSRAGGGTTHVKVEAIKYNVEVPKGIFDTSVPRGWRVIRR